MSTTKNIKVVPPRVADASKNNNNSTPATSSRHDSVFALFNVGRSLRCKTAMIEKLFSWGGHPHVIALQEVGVDLLDTLDIKRLIPKRSGPGLQASIALQTVIGDLGYNVFNSYSFNTAVNVNAPTHGGSALLINNKIITKEYHWREAENCDFIDSVSREICSSHDFSYIVTSLYLRPSFQEASDPDCDELRRILRSMPGNMIILTDLNAQIRGIGGVTDNQYRKRGDTAEEVILENDIMLVPLAGPSTFERNSTDTEIGFNNDHILVGRDLYSRISSADQIAVPLRSGSLDDELGASSSTRPPRRPPRPSTNDKADLAVADPGRTGWASDHLPIIWSFSLGSQSRRGAAEWKRSPLFHRATEDQLKLYNHNIVRIMRHHLRTRNYCLANLEDCLRKVALKHIPHSRPSGKYHARFWIDQSRAQFDEVVSSHGASGVQQQTDFLKKSKEEILSKMALDDADPGSCWKFLQRAMGFGKTNAAAVPLRVHNPNSTDPPREITDPREMVDAKAERFAEASEDPISSDTKAQEELKEHKKHLRERYSADLFHDVAFSELRAAIRKKNSGRCADTTGLKAEHLKALDDKTLLTILPLFDHCIRHGNYPKHWRIAKVTPIPKKNRDLSILKSWRPVSVTSLLSRVCEDIVISRISHAWDKNREGKSQFGFRQGIGTNFPITALSMFANDGFQQTVSSELWNAFDSAQEQVTRRSQGQGTAEDKRTKRQHSTLIVAIDASDAFCKAIAVRAVKKLSDLGLHTEALWMSEMLSDRQLYVSEDGFKSKLFDLMRSVPQGSVCGPLIFGLVIDDLIRDLEKKCTEEIAGTIAVPVCFADDVNLAVRGYNPTSVIKKANALMRVIKRWSVENDIPMAKLQATWINRAFNKDHLAEVSRLNPIVFDENLSCIASTDPIRILGVWFDSTFTFQEHVNKIIEPCEQHLNLLRSLKYTLSAEKLLVLYKGIILSRLLFAIEAWYPYITEANRARLQTLHYQGCRIITGAMQTAHASSTIFESSLRNFDEIARDSIARTADHLRRFQPPTTPSTDHVFGMDWFLRLVHCHAAPTASPRPTLLTTGELRIRQATFKPVAVLTKRGDSLREVLADIKRETRTDEQNIMMNHDAYKFAPHELSIYDKHIRIFSSPPGGLKKPDDDPMLWPDETRKAIHEANQQRLQDLLSSVGAVPDDVSETLFGYSDGSKDESLPKKCAGGFVVNRGLDIAPDESTVLQRGHVPAGPLACIYSAELVTLHELLQYCIDNVHLIKNKKLIICSDSQSALRAIEQTWARKLQPLELETSRLLFRLATLGIDVALGFVFSHAGVAGNDLADEEAAVAVSRIGRHSPAKGYATRDTIREYLKIDHKRKDHLAAYVHRNRDSWNQVHEIQLLQEHEPDQPLAPAFRFATIDSFFNTDFPGSEWPAQPSAILPGSQQLDESTRFTRQDEINIYSARVGLIPSVGGHFQDAPPSPCPLCGCADALGRQGRTVKHIFDSCSRVSDLRQQLHITKESLWKAVPSAALFLRRVIELSCLVAQQ